MLGPVLVKHNNDIPFMVGSFTVALMLSHQLQLYFSLLRISLSSLSKHCVKIAKSLVVIMTTVNSVPKQLNGSHVCVPKKTLWGLNCFLILRLSFVPRNLK